MNISQTIKDLKLPADSFVVLGGGVLSILGIREAKDLDLAVTEDAYKTLLKRGWKEGEKYGLKAVSRGNVSASVNALVCGQWVTVEELLEGSKKIAGIAFMDLAMVKKWKQYTARPKDLRDVRLIETYESQF